MQHGIQVHPIQTFQGASQELKIHLDALSAAKFIRVNRSRNGIAVYLQAQQKIDRWKLHEAIQSHYDNVVKGKDIKPYHDLLNQLERMAQ